MKKILFLLLIIISILSIINVKAETCDPDKITIESISIEEKNDNTEEIENATATGKKINLNLSMSDVGDNIKYKIVIKNDSNKDYTLSDNSLNIESEYINYNFEIEDKNNVVKANTSKVVYLKVAYKKEIPSEAMDNDSYNEKKEVALKVSDNEIINPKTQRNIMIFVVIALLIISTILISIKNKKIIKPMLLVIGLLFPVATYALCEANFEIDLQLKIEKKCVPFKDENSWEGIIDSVKNNKTECMNVGDTKTVDMGSLGTHTLRISNMSTPSECLTPGFSQTACGFVIEFADSITSYNMNQSDTNVGGWPVTEMRTYVNSDVHNALPTEIKNAIIDTIVVSGHGTTAGETNFNSTDKIYLLSTHEVWEDVDGNPNTGIDYYDTGYNSTRQLDYYRDLGVTTSNPSGAIKQKSSLYESYWWLRSPRLSHYFFYISMNGYSGYYEADSHYDLSPAFRIG